MFHIWSVPPSFPPKFRVRSGRSARHTRQKGVPSMRRSYDESYPEGVWMTQERLNQLTGGRPMTDTMWKCDQLRAGQLYNRMMFDTRAEAEQFAHKMQQVEPDQVFDIEAIAAHQVWN